ncbi:ABC transporter substrate-binding protein [Mesorhizobium amorphae]|uniref:ABC transporter substrate-binding protein n=1 Tax=Mesorhizobium amorphae TaxID=71433 RepID=UPI00177CE883|nr:ABC transporter substrate-binding protein [Mesorhizobium amorphae]
MQIIQSRRRFLAGATAAGTAGLLNFSTAARAEPPPETTKVRFPVFINASDCQAPMYVSEALLHAEGFTDISFVPSGTGPDSADWLANGEIDFDWNFPPSHVLSIGKGAPIKVLAGMHVGCLELIANDGIRSVPDLKGKRVGIVERDGIGHLLLMLMTAYVGLDPARDIEWVSSEDQLQMFADGSIDAFLATPPQPQLARERKLGHVLIDTAIDRPWAQYYCCMLATSAAFAQQYPIATKRVLRAMLKAVDLCVSDPEQVARDMVAGGFANNYGYALKTLSDARYDKWRDYDPEDSMRFYALRMQETGIVEVSPNKVIADGTDWSFIDELKRELKT